MSLFRRRRSETPPAALVREAEWPFAGHVFPQALACVASGSVTAGGLPVMQVAHAPDGSWMVSDGLGFPTGAEGDEVVSLARLVEKDPSLGVLAIMLPPGSQADRPTQTGGWKFSPFQPPQEA